jgi:hypothetical protein
VPAVEVHRPVEVLHGQLDELERVRLHADVLPGDGMAGAVAGEEMARG